MSAFLYIWNPNKWNWSDLQDAIYRVNNNEQYDSGWSCGNTKRIKIGDIFFLMRLGLEPKGIIGCGYVLSNPEIGDPWDDQKKSAIYTDILFKALSEEPIFSLSYLQNNHPTFSWTPQSSGISIPNQIAEELFLLIQNNLKFSFQPLEEQSIKEYAEGRPKIVTNKTYDRSSAARQDCIEYYGYSCRVCGFNFEEKYGAFGMQYIEVHHLKQMSDINNEYSINPIRDLRPVCANCHRMLHKTRPPLSIEELKKHLI
ncbi:MAG: HNH endonuclease [Methylococcales bacterium]